MKKKIDSQLVLAIAVLIISGAALIVSVRQATIMNRQTDILLEQTKSNAWPRLSIGLDQSWPNGKLKHLKIPIHNKGTGPAIIEGVRITYDKQVTKDWWDLFQKAKVPDSVDRGISNSSIYNSVFSANESLYWMQLTNNYPLTKWIYDNREKIIIEICYKSVFNEYWLLRKQGLGGNMTIEKLEVPKSPLSLDEMFKS